MFWNGLFLIVHFVISCSSSFKLRAHVALLISFSPVSVCVPYACLSVRPQTFHNLEFLSGPTYVDAFSGNVDLSFFSNHDSRGRLVPQLGLNFWKNIKIFSKTSTANRVLYLYHYVKTNLKIYIHDIYSCLIYSLFDTMYIFGIITIVSQMRNVAWAGGPQTFRIFWRPH